MIEADTVEAQLSAIATQIGSYWKLSHPFDETTVEYLKRRPYDINRLSNTSDDIKAQVLIANPDLIHSWVKRGYLRSPAQPHGFHDAIVRELLTKLGRNFAYRLVEKTIKGMRVIGYQWPEFDVMEKSIKWELAREERLRNEKSDI